MNFFVRFQAPEIKNANPVAPSSPTSCFFFFTYPEREEILCRVLCADQVEKREREDLSEERGERPVHFMYYLYPFSTCPELLHFGAFFFTPKKFSSCTAGMKRRGTALEWRIH